MLRLDRLDAQLVISLGGGSPESLSGLPVPQLLSMPQLELLKPPSPITHGMNTTLSLSNGVPMVAIPIANDQPGGSIWTGAGEVVPARLSVPKLRAAIQRVLTEDYKNNATRLQAAIVELGVSRAMLGGSLSTGEPVLREHSNK